MIRLVHQFDDPRTRPSAAAPKSGGGEAGCCGGPCCCCCCIGTIIAASLLTARSMGRNFPPVPDAQLHDPHMFEQIPEVRRLHLGWWRVGGFFFLPLMLAAWVRMGASGFAPLLYVFALLVLHRRLGMHPAVVAALILGIPVVSVIEILIWARAGF